MALQDTDLLVVNRGGTNYQVSVADFKSQVGIMGNVIYGTAGVSSAAGNQTTVTHASVDLAKSYIVLSTSSNFDGNNGNITVGVFVSDRTTTSFTLRTNGGSTSIQVSYFLIY